MRALPLMRQGMGGHRHATDLSTVSGSAYFSLWGERMPEEPAPVRIWLAEPVRAVGAQPPRHTGLCGAAAWASAMLAWR